MLTIIVDKSNIKDKYIEINEKQDINHIVNVYRLRVEDEIRIVDGEKEYVTKIKELNKKRITTEIITIQEDNYSLDKQIDIAMGIIKNDKMNLLIQKLTEIGISNIIPLKTNRVIVKINEKKDKWEDIVKEALKQCRGVKFTNITEIKKISELDFLNYDKVIFAYEQSERTVKIINEIKDADKKILYIIGPEGGFTKEEVEYLRDNNVIEVSLGKRILRAETAAIVLGGILSNV